MEIKYFDVHSHIQDKRFEADAGEVIRRMTEGGVAALVVGTDQEMSDRALKIVENSDNVWAVIGQHPTDKRNEAFEPGFYDNLIKRGNSGSRKRVVGIGECGLDYFRGSSESEEKGRQKQIFLAQIDLAARFDLPLMVHCRPSQGIGGVDAYMDCVDILKDAQAKYGKKVRGNVHFFAGDTSIARKFLDLGFTMSFTGVLTFTHDYDEVVRYIPLESLLSETDCPYVAPVPHRGKRNEPAFVVEVVRAISTIKKENFEIIRSTLVTNARRVFHI